MAALVSLGDHIAPEPTLLKLRMRGGTARPCKQTGLLKSVSQKGEYAGAELVVRGGLVESRWISEIGVKGPIVGDQRSWEASGRVAEGGESWPSGPGPLPVIAESSLGQGEPGVEARDLEEIGQGKDAEMTSISCPGHRWCCQHRPMTCLAVLPLAIENGLWF